MHEGNTVGKTKNVFGLVLGPSNLAFCLWKDQNFGVIPENVVSEQFELLVEALLFLLLFFPCA